MRRTLRAGTIALLPLLAWACSDRPDPAGPEAAPRLSRAADRTAVIVALDPGTAPVGHAAAEAEARDVARGLGIQPTHLYGTALFGFAATVNPGQLDALEKNPRVARITEDAPVSLPDPVESAAPPCDSPPCDGGGGGDDSGQVVPWGVDRIGGEPGETEIGDGNDGSGVHVYVIDTGIDSNHGDLNDNLGNGHAVQSCKGSPSLCLQPWDDDNGHGTHVSGTVGAEDNSEAVVGVADAVTLHAVKVLDKSGSGSFSDVIDGVDWVASETSDRGEPTVANMSLGASRDESGTDCGSSNLHQAMCNARDVGVVFAVAAGNDGADAEGFVPASYHNAVITQSATSGDGDASNADDDWPSWSNWGDNSASWDNDSGQHSPVTLAAPGVDILSTTNDGGTGTKSGTSMASPHVAGAAALALKEYDITATDKTAFQDVRSNLLGIDESTDDWDNSSGNPHDEDFVDVRN